MKKNLMNKENITNKNIIKENTSSNENKKEKNKQIEVLRGFLMLMIVFFHYTYRFTQLYGIQTINFLSLNKWGTIGVGGFFIITGYFLVPQNLENYDIKDFLIKKIKRIYPSYVLCITLIFISIKIWGLDGRESNFLDYFLNLSLLNGFIDTRYIDGAHWYISYLIIFYIVIGVILKFNKKASVFLPIWLIIKDIFKLITVNIPQISIIYKMIGGNYVEFILIGIALKEILKKVTIEKKLLKEIFRENFIYLLVIFISILQICIADGKIVTIGIILFLLMFLLMLRKKYNVTKYNILYFLGGMSYIIYLIHQNIGYQILLGLYDINKEFKFIYIIITFSIILIISYIINKFFEEKVQNIIEKRKG